MTEPFVTVTVGPRNAYTDATSGLRYYRWQGRDLPSVTSIRRMAGVPHNLHQWALSQVIDAAVDGAAEIPKMLAQGADGLKAVRSALRKASTAERDAKAALGTAVHDAAAQGLALTDVAPELRPFLRQYQGWLATSGATILASEFQTWNLAAGYAGTADLMCRMRDGSVWLVDLKTGKGVYPDHALQLMAYAMAEFVGEDDIVDMELTGLLHEIRGLAVLHLAPRSWEFLQIKSDPGVWNAFRGLLEFSRWSKDHAAVETYTGGVRRSSDREAVA